MSNEQADAAKAAAEERARIEHRRRYVSDRMSPKTYGLTGAPLDTPAAVGDALTRLRAGGVNLLGPEVHLDYLPRNHIVSLRWAFLDLYNPPMTGKSGKMSNGIWYQQVGGGVSPHFTALNQLAGLCGMVWLDFQRTDDGRTPLYWRFSGRARCKFFDGTEREVTGVGESDLRDGGAEASTVNDGGQLARMRAKGSQRAESIAKARIIREMFGLRQKFSEDEADMPWVFPALVYVAPADAQIDRLMAMKELGLLGSVYGHKRDIIDVEPLALPEPVDPVDYAAENARLANRERVPVGGSAPVPVAAPIPQRAPAMTDPDEDRPPFEAPARPAAPAMWRGTIYTLAEVVDYCAAKNWPDPSKETEANVAKLEAWIRGDRGGADIRSFLGRA